MAIKVSCEQETVPVHMKDYRPQLFSLKTTADIMGVDQQTVTKLVHEHPEWLENKIVVLVQGNFRVNWSKAEHVMPKFLNHVPKGRRLSTGVKSETYIDAKAEKEKYAAQNAKLEFEIKSGKLIEIEQVTQTWTHISKAVQRAILGVPDRISSMLVGEKDSATIHKRLSEELKHALKNMAYELKEHAKTLKLNGTKIKRGAIKLDGLNKINSTN